MENFPIDKAFHFLEPGPVVLLTTKHKNKMNIMTLSWQTLIDFTPIIGCIVSPGDYSFEALSKTKECVISIPTIDMIKKVVDIGNCSGKDVDKFDKFKLTPVEASQVDAPLIKECLANIECKVIDTSLVNKYCLFVMEGVHVWYNSKQKEKRTFHANGDGTFVVDGRTYNLKKRMVKFLDMV